MNPTGKHAGSSGFWITPDPCRFLDIRYGIDPLGIEKAEMTQGRAAGIRISIGLLFMLTTLLSNWALGRLDPRVSHG
jgi:hypothetical protein